MEDPNVIAKATAQHFKPYFIIIGILVAITGPALFFHGPAFWMVMLAWWAFLVGAGLLALKLAARRSRS